MATEQQIAQLIRLVEQTQPGRFFGHMDRSQAGIGAVMRILGQAQEPVTAGRIAQIMDVSTARVAVLLKKMESRGLIVKRRDPADARVTIVCLSEQGAQEDAALRAQIAQRIAEAIDRVGMERMMEFIAVAREIGECFCEPPSME